MKTILTSAAVGSVALIGAIALAQQPAAGSLAEITVSASRMNAKPVVSTVGWPRAPVNEVTLSYAISAAGLDLTTDAGKADLEKRVRDAAEDVCKEIGRQYPDSTPDDAACAKAAASKAMVRVRKLVAAAEVAAGK